MNILILAAMDKELSLIKEIISENSLHILSNLKIIEGKIGNHNIYLSKCGIGKVNAALNCERILNNLQVDLVINSGVAGGTGLPIGSLLIADRTCYDDVWCGPGTNYGQADGCPEFFKSSELFLKKSHELTDFNPIYGLLCTGDKFISTSEEVSFIRSKFPEVCGVDMESAALAQTCFQNEKEFASIRIISDTPGEGENIEQYKNFWKDAPVKTFKFLSKLIEIL